MTLVLLIIFGTMLTSYRSLLRVPFIRWNLSRGLIGDRNSLRGELSIQAKKSHSKGGVLQFDGGSRGNPGIGGAGAVIMVDEDLKEVWSGYFFIGRAGITNNVAEYNGLIEGLQQALKMNISPLLIQGDSQLVIRQIQGTYRVRNEQLKMLHKIAVDMILQIPSCQLAYIPREINKRADELSNMAMDRMSSGVYLDPSLAGPKKRVRRKVSSEASSDGDSSSSSDSNDSNENWGDSLSISSSRGHDSSDINRLEAQTNSSSTVSFVPPAEHLEVVYGAATNITASSRFREEKSPPIRGVGRISSPIRGPKKPSKRSYSSLSPATIRSPSIFIERKSNMKIVVIPIWKVQKLSAVYDENNSILLSERMEVREVSTRTGGDQNDGSTKTTHVNVASIQLLNQEIVTEESISINEWQSESTREESSVQERDGNTSSSFIYHHSSIIDKSYLVETTSETSFTEKDILQYLERSKMRVRIVQSHEMAPSLSSVVNIEDFVDKEGTMVPEEVAGIESESDKTREKKKQGQGRVRVKVEAEGVISGEQRVIQLDAISSVSAYVAEIDTSDRFVVKLITKNNLAYEEYVSSKKLNSALDGSGNNDIGSGIRHSHRSRAKKNKIDLLRNCKLIPIRIGDLKDFLDKEASSGKIVDEFLYAWAMGLQFSRLSTVYTNAAVARTRTTTISADGIST